jgi:hypothetical protein
MSGCEEDIEKATGERASTVKFKEKKILSGWIYVVAMFLCVFELTNMFIS